RRTGHEIGVKGAASGAICCPACHDRSGSYGITHAPTVRARHHIWSTERWCSDLPTGRQDIVLRAQLRPPISDSGITAIRNGMVDTMGRGVLGAVVGSAARCRTERYIHRLYIVPSQVGIHTKR